MVLSKPLTGEPALSLRERAVGKRYYYAFHFFNSLSWATLAEGVVILMLLRLGATETWVGVITALQYITLPAMALGYWTTPRLGVTGTAGLYWSLRSCSAAFMIAAPWAAAWGENLGLWLMFVGSLGFMLGRAGGLMAFTGIVTELTTSRDRGDLISNSSKISQTGTILMTVLMALFLGVTAPLSRYQVFFSVGMVSGLIAATAMWKVPESGMFRDIPPFRILEELRWSVATRGRRWFMAMMVGIPLTQGVTYAFGVLVAKQGYGLSDRDVVLFVLLSTLGGIIASYTYSLFLDQLGSRPLLVLTSIVDLVGVALVVVLPVHFHPALLGLLFFINGYVQIAFNAAMQHYFISISNREHQLAQGIITRGMGGIAGGMALALAGWTLEHVKLGAIDPADPLQHFRWFYAGLLVLVALRTVVFFKLPPLRSQGIRDALNALLSPWDWRAIHAVKRAVAVQSEDKETQALWALTRAGAAVYREDLERYLMSPSIFVRQRAMESLTLVRPSRSVVDILREDLRVNLYTTAHLSAYWLGHWQVHEATSELREAVNSPDFLLRGKAIHALVELDDRQALPLIEAHFRTSDNPYVLIEGARALSVWGDWRHYALLLDKYHLYIPPQAKDEFSLSVTRLLGLYRRFYMDLGMLRRDPGQLFREWHERLAAADTDGLIEALRIGAPRRSLLEATLARRRPLFRTWFHQATTDFLYRRPENVWPEMAFLLTFLLLSADGAHLNHDAS